MQTSEQDGILFVRLFPGEDVPACLSDACRKHAIVSGALVCGIGMLRGIELGYFDRSAGRYESHSFPEPMELVSMNGNIARDGDGIMVHAHAALAGRDGRMVGGHLSRATVEVTAEIVIVRSTVPASRKIEGEAGLKGLFLDE